MSISWKKCLAGAVGFALTFSVLAQTRVEYIHTDALGSPVAVTDASGNVVEREVYEPYGSSITGPPSDQPGFTGHVADSQTNLAYMQQRYYDPQVGRFLSVDPVTAYSSPVGAFGRYSYANNNPYRFTDPDGRASCESGSIKCHPSIASSVRTIGPAGNVSSSAARSSDRSGGQAALTGGLASAGAGAIPGTTAPVSGSLSGVGAFLRSLLGRAIITAPLVIAGDSRTPQYVVRGGICTLDRFCGGSGVTIDEYGNLKDVSVQSFRGVSVPELSQRQWVPNNKIGVTTVEAVQAMGGEVISTPNRKNPYHATLGGITPAQAEILFTPAVDNPNPRP